MVAPERENPGTKQGEPLKEADPERGRFGDRGDIGGDRRRGPGPKARDHNQDPRAGQRGGHERQVGEELLHLGLGLAAEIDALDQVLKGEAHHPGDGGGKHDSESRRP